MSKILSRLEGKKEIEILYSEEEIMSLDEIRTYVGKEAFKIYKGLLKKLENAEIKENPERIAACKKSIIRFKSQYGVYKAEILKQVNLINTAFGKGIKVKMPKYYKPFFNQINKKVCKKCHTPTLARDGTLILMCVRCNTTFSTSTDDED